MTTRTKLLGVLLAAASALASGCTTLSKSYSFNTPNPEILPLHRNEYKILGDTEGKACGDYVLYARWPWFGGIPTKTVGYGGSSFMCSIPIIGDMFCGDEAIANEAFYNALENMPGADSIMSPRVVVSKTYSWISFFYKQQCATVRGKAFEYKTDTKS
jgi:hypothetical protein